MKLLPKPGLWLAITGTMLAIAFGNRRYGEMSFAHSIRKGNLARLKATAASGDPIKAQNEDGTTVLMVAADAGDLDYVRQLLSQGAEVNAINGSGHTSLYLAAKAGRMDVVRVLLSAGARLHTENDDDWDTPRSAAKRAGYHDISQMLAERERLSRQLLGETQAEWEGDSAGRQGPVLDPSRLGRWRALLERGADPDWVSFNGDSLWAVTAADDEPAVRLLLEYHGDPGFVSRHDADLMGVASGIGAIGILTDLLQRGGKVEGLSPFETPLGEAICAGKRDTVRFLLDHGADPNSTFYNQKLLSLAREVHPDLVPLLKSRGARP